jgi:hypothetical protein
MFIIMWWKNDAMVKDLDCQCVGEGWSPHICNLFECV